MSQPIPEGPSGRPTDRFGSAKQPGRAAVHGRPAGLDDAEVRALGKLSEALEVVEHARGALYEFHRLSGQADLTLQDAVTGLRDAGHPTVAEEIEACLVGRDVVEDMWTFQLVETYDAQYWQVFREVECWARRSIGDGSCAPHLFEAEMKVQEQKGSA